MNDWTTDQLEAITNKGGTLLVSAAAGSGKTAVLVERIIRRVTEERIPINKFLVVTFTNMAAKEMKEKIVRAIAKKILEEPRNLFLRDQLSLVHKAQITTIHSFCFNLIRENFTELAISPDFKIISDLDAIILKKDCMDSVISKFFMEMSNEFKVLVDILGENKIEDEMLWVYNFIQSSSKPEAFLENVCENYKDVVEKGFNQSIWYQIICTKVQNKIQNCLELSQKALDLCKLDEILSDKNLDILLMDRAFFDDISREILQNNWDSIYYHLENVNFKAWKACTKSQNKDIVALAKGFRDNYKAELISIKELIYLPIDKINQQTDKLYGAMRALKNVLIEFDNQYKSEKIRKNVLDFNDAEHKVYDLLFDDKKGEKSNIAKEISQKFVEIMVDEYQDTNEIQDTLFKLLSRDEQNIFMVGDVKQSIYKFRLADPTIFLEKYLSFDSVDRATEGQPRKVSLSRNFRSRDEILQSTNFIFENIMSEKTGGIDYKEDQKLYYGANYEEYSRSQAEFCLVDFDQINAENKTTTEVEAMTVASKIIELIESGFKVSDPELGYMRTANLSDIVILLRSTSTKAYIYKEVLENAGINVDFKEGTEKLFGTPEVSNFISLFKVLDNCLLDVDMIAIMRSRIFDFTDDEIAMIRLSNSNNSFYDNITQSDDEKCKEFLEKLQKIKEYSQNNTIFKTIWYVIHEYNLLAKYSLMSNGKMRHNNILRFLDFVNTLDESISVYDFVNFLNRIDNKKATLPSGVKSGFSVKIMTMHASKGLEFPIVFLADIAKEFNKMDLRKPLIIHNKLGIGMKYIDDDNIVSYPSLMQKAIKMQIQDEIIAEEMRVLYVAMTRAKEKMYVMCTVKNAEKTFEKWLFGRDVLECNSYHYWFGMNIIKLPSAKVFYEEFNVLEGIKIDGDLPNYFKCNYINSIGSLEIASENTDKQSQFIYQPNEYLYKKSTEIPSKLTATDAFNKEQEQSFEYEKKPKFLSNVKLTASERGIAHHIVMQFIDFEKCNDIPQISQQIKRLYQDKFITKTQFECISPYKINAFINSEIGNRARRSDKLIREFKFSILVSACEFYDVDVQDKVLLQGVIDCMFIENGKIILIDYKTDSVNINNIDEVSKEHAKQLSIYAKAIEKIYEMGVSEKYLYYFKTESFYKI